MMQNIENLKISSFYLKQSQKLLVFNEIFICLAVYSTTVELYLQVRNMKASFFRMLEAVIRAV
jgi:hypothetical protein